MPDYNALVKGFQGGAEFAQNFRERRQLEKHRDFALEGENYDMEARRASRKATNPDVAAELGSDYAAGNVDWAGQLPDPFAFKMLDWFKSKHKGKKKKAIDAGAEIAPTDSTVATAAAPVAEAAPVDDENAYGYADGGSLDEVKGARRSSTFKEPPAKKGFVRRAINSKTGRAGAALAVGSALLDQTDEDADSRYAKRFGWEEYPAGSTEPSVGGYAQYLGKRALGFASDLGDKLTMGLAGKLYRDNEADPQAVGAAVAPPPRTAIPTPQAAAPAAPVAAAAAPRAAIQQRPQRQSEMADFSKIDIDPHEVPDMKTNDWKKYRAELMAAAQKSGDPGAVARAGDMVTDMQQKGFISYGQQGLALQQAGNVRGAMAAYRAAYQYFPNGHDVEFGLHNGHIVGVGKDEETGARVKGTEMVMDPERVSALLENFKNPQAFRMWTKDWRDFQQGQRQYAEVTKPLAQAQGEALRTNSEANVLRAENAALRAGGAGGAGAATNMRNAEHVFRQRVQMLGIQDEGQADQLASIMSRVKQANPTIPDNTIVQVIMQSQSDGTLAERLKRMGLQ